MRDLKRLKPIYDKICHLHETKIPDWRIGQFLLNFIEWYYSKYHRDIFYIPDEKIFNKIEEFINDITNE